MENHKAGIAICTECKAEVPVFVDEDAHICNCCGKPFIVKKGIQLYKESKIDNEDIDDEEKNIDDKMDSYKSTCNREEVPPITDFKQWFKYQAFEKKYLKRNLIICSVLLFALLICVFTVKANIENSINASKGLIQLPKSTSSYVNMNYEQVSDELRNAGFINITYETKDDLVLGWLNSEGDVASITVNGESSVSSSKWLDSDSEIIIVYHTFPTKEEIVYADFPEIEYKNTQNVGEELIVSGISFNIPKDWLYHKEFMEQDDNDESIKSTYYIDNNDEASIFVLKKDFNVDSENDVNSYFTSMIKDSFSDYKLVDTKEICVDGLVGNKLSFVGTDSVMVITFVYNPYKNSLIYFLMGESANSKYSYGSSLEQIFTEGKIISKTPSASSFSGKNYLEVEKSLQEAGFTNIQMKRMDDLVFAILHSDGEVESVAINNSINYDGIEDFNKDAVVVITYHSFPKNVESSGDKQMDEDLENIFELSNSETIEPQYEYPMRAAVVILTNSFSEELWDNNTIQKSKVHAYNDNSGTYACVASYGKWSVIDDNKWHVDNMKLQYVNGSVCIASMDIYINNDGNYTLANPTGSLGTLASFENGQAFNLDSLMSYTKDEQEAFFIVTPEMIEEDRPDDFSKLDTSVAKNAEVNNEEITSIDIQVALDAYCDRVFTYGCKLKWASAQWKYNTDGSYTVSVPARIKNQYGTKGDYTVYATLWGTNPDNILIREFNYY